MTKGIKPPIRRRDKQDNQESHKTSMVTSARDKAEDLKTKYSFDCPGKHRRFNIRYDTENNATIMTYACPNSPAGRIIHSTGYEVDSKKICTSCDRSIVGSAKHVEQANKATEKFEKLANASAKQRK
jgi:hypothetical protein